MPKNCSSQLLISQFISNGTIKSSHLYETKCMKFLKQFIRLKSHQCYPFDVFVIVTLQFFLVSYLSTYLNPSRDRH